MIVELSRNGDAMTSRTVNLDDVDKVAKANGASVMTVQLDDQDLVDQAIKTLAKLFLDGKAQKKLEIDIELQKKQGRFKPKNISLVLR